jgi:DNA-binding GntR family transcriptional regulator
MKKATPPRERSETPPARVRGDDIAGELRRAIASGELPVGALLPTEMQLARRYATSRHTVRAALDQLTRLGLVSRRRRVGARVEACAARGGFLPSLSSVEELAQFGATHLRAVRSLGPATLAPALARRLELSGGPRCLRIAGVRVDARGGPPIGWTDVYVDMAFAEIGPLARAAPGVLVSALIERRFGVVAAEIVQRVRAVAIPAKRAAALDVESGAPGLEIVRRYLDADGRAFEASVTLHPAQRFEIEMRLRRSPA